MLIWWIIAECWCLNWFRCWHFVAIYLLSNSNEYSNSAYLNSSSLIWYKNNCNILMTVYANCKMWSDIPWPHYSIYVTGPSYTVVVVRRQLVTNCYNSQLSSLVHLFYFCLHVMQEASKKQMQYWSNSIITPRVQD